MTNRPLRRTPEYWRQVAALVFSALAGVKVVLSLGGGGVAWWKITLSCAIVALAALAYRYVWHEEKKRAPVAAGRPDALVPKNREWLAEQGRMLIVTRDMSWSVDPAISAALFAKAENGELMIFAWQQTPFLQELRERGADVYTLDGSPPQVRFTVLRWGASDERVLVHRQVRGEVEFFEIGPTDFPAYGLTRDVVDLLRRTTVEAAKGIGGREDPRMASEAMPEARDF